MKKAKMKKTFVLDTNVIVHDPCAPWNFQDNVVIIPLPVLSELDTLKTKEGTVGANVRCANRKLYEAITKYPNGVIPTKAGGVIKLIPIQDKSENSQLGSKNYTDNILLEFVASNSYILVTKDIAMALKGIALGIHVQDYKNDKQNLTLGQRTVRLTASQSDNISEGKDITLKAGGSINEYVEAEVKDYGSIPLRCLGGQNYKITPQYLKFITGEMGYEINLPGNRKVLPRNIEQWMLADAITHPGIKLVSALGKAGTGKTYISIAAALSEVLDKHRYEKVYITRPIIQLGKDLGALPGTLEEKLNPFLQPFFDNLGNIFKEKAAYTKYLSSGIITVEALSYIRGRSLSNAIMIVDEAQNLTPHEVKTIVTRMGENSKLILLGDPAQIDNPYLDFSSNGLVYAYSKLKGSEITAMITLTKGERSELAELAANKL